MKLWVLPFFIGILAIFSGNLAYLVSLDQYLGPARLLPNSRPVQFQRPDQMSATVRAYSQQAEQKLQQAISQRNATAQAQVTEVGKECEKRPEDAQKQYQSREEQQERESRLKMISKQKL